jgi:HD domain
MPEKFWLNSSKPIVYGKVGLPSLSGSRSKQTRPLFPRKSSSGDVSTMDLAAVIEKMKQRFGDDSKRIEHAQAVLGFARRISEREEGDADVVFTAAVLHDIGIIEGERKYNSSAPRYQEQEGPPLAAEIMSELGLDEQLQDHVCRIIANHHSAKDIDTPEFRIIWDADWLVNIADEFPHYDKVKLERLIERVFRTKTGLTLARERYLGET